MSEELKPCPFCGSSMVIYTTKQEYLANPNSYPYGKGVHCINPDCMSINIPHYWNTRPIEDALNKRIAELEERIAKNNVKAAKCGLKLIEHIEELTIPGDVLETLIRTVHHADMSCGPNTPNETTYKLRNALDWLKARKA